jgi:hypothetical protein
LVQEGGQDGVSLPSSFRVNVLMFLEGELSRPAVLLDFGLVDAVRLRWILGHRKTFAGSHGRDLGRQTRSRPELGAPVARAKGVRSRMLPLASERDTASSKAHASDASTGSCSGDEKRAGPVRVEYGSHTCRRSGPRRHRTGASPRQPPLPTTARRPHFARAILLTVALCTPR